MQPLHPDDIPTLVYANEKGEIKNFPELSMAGRSGNFFLKPLLDDLIPLPEGSELFLLPDRMPIGISPGDEWYRRLQLSWPRHTLLSIVPLMNPQEMIWLPCLFLHIRLSAGLMADSGCQPFAVILTSDRMHDGLILKK
jgi:hypothetical protein